MAQQTAVEWLVEQFKKTFSEYIKLNPDWEVYEQAKAMEKEQIGYTEEQAYEIWKAGQEYWKTSGRSITFQELIEKYKVKQEIEKL